MKLKNTSVGLVLLLTIGLMAATVFSLGCAEQEAPAEPEEANGAEPAETTPEDLDQAVVEEEEVEQVEVEQEEAGMEEPGIEEPGMDEAEQEGSEKEGDEQEEVETTLAEEITNIEWQWIELQEPGLAGKTEVSNPEDYTIVFSRHGTYSIKADCNRGGGSYTLEGNSLTLGAGPMTLAECGPLSLYDQYVTLLSEVNSVEMENGQIVLYSGGEDTMMIFTNGGVVEGI
ncbi:META domain-containing protein [Methanosarcina sp. Mfa9]|uniref:META domain-containing protein n=1 Tax=Methanosarcina sp. Mfa9 TaxID=3439063 RepID=UPI003F845557